MLNCWEDLDDTNATASAVHSLSSSHLSLGSSVHFWDPPGDNAQEGLPSELPSCRKEPNASFPPDHTLSWVI